MNNTKKILSLSIILVILFIIILFTRTQWQDYTMNKAELDSKKEKQQQLIQEINKYETLKKKIKADKNNNVNTYIIDLKEDEILDYIYKEIEKGSKKPGLSNAKVKSLSISQPVKDDKTGFLVSNVSLNIEVEDKKRLISILNFLTHEKSTYKFFIPRFSFEEKEGSNSSIRSSVKKEYMQVSIPLQLYYK